AVTQPCRLPFPGEQAALPLRRGRVRSPRREPGTHRRAPGTRALVAPRPAVRGGADRCTIAGLRRGAAVVAGNPAGRTCRYRPVECGGRRRGRVRSERVGAAVRVTHG